MGKEERTYEQGWFDGLRIAARWVHYLTEAAAEMGVDVEELTDRSLYLKTRQNNGEPELKAAKGIRDAVEFYMDMYGTYPAPTAMDHEVAVVEEDRLEVRVYKCAHVTEWEKLGLPRERIAQLCRFLTKADHGCYDTYEHLDVALPTSLANGDPYCTLDIRPRKVPLEELGDKPGETAALR